MISLILTGALLNTASAAEPTKASDGSICMRVIIPASEADIRQQIDTANEANSLVGSAKITGSEKVGDCERLTYKTPGLITSLTYTAMRCPTASGWEETLVESDSFTDNRSSWTLRPVEGGTEIDYRVRVRLNIPVGQSMIDAQIAQSLKRAIERLEERVSGN